MDTRPIAVFDSGLGGLTAVRALLERWPGENVIYCGDTARVPYGTRSEGTILKFTRQALTFLRRFSPKAVVVACGTASTVALPLIRQETPLIGVVKPSVERAAALTRNRRVGLIATPASVRSGAYAKHMAKVAPDVIVTAHDGRLLVPLIEAGRVKRGDPAAELLVGEYMQPFLRAGVDTLILGCTHYPLLSSLIDAALRRRVALINSGEAAILSLEGQIKMNNGKEPGTRQFFVSDDIEGFAEQTELFLGQRVTGKVESIDLEKI